MTSPGELAAAVRAWQAGGPAPVPVTRHALTPGVWVLTSRSTLDHALDIEVYPTLDDAIPELVEEITVAVGEGPRQEVTIEASDLDSWIEVCAGAAIVRLDRRTIGRRPPDPERER